LRALEELARILKENRTIVLVVPHKDETFDHGRPVTLLDHQIEDHEREVGEDELTHLPEMLALHDLGLDPPAGSFGEFEERSERNVENRCLITMTLTRSWLLKMLDHASVQIYAVGPVYCDRTLLR